MMWNVFNENFQSKISHIGKFPEAHNLILLQRPMVE